MQTKGSLSNDQLSGAFTHEHVLFIAISHVVDFLFDFGTTHSIGKDF